MFDISLVMRQAAEARASDIFIKAGVPPSIRVNGRVSVLDYPPFSPEEVREIISSFLTSAQLCRFEQRHEMDLAFSVEGVSRFRANIYQQRGTMGMVLRLIPLEITPLDKLGMPPIVSEMCGSRQGLILVTGPTGSGKSTTLAGIIDRINSTRPTNIVCVEDPIEFVHTDKMAIVNQREIGIDTDSFEDALKYVVRQSPDIILIGEMRDAETLNVVLQAAETGHLVLSTLHTSSAPETVERIVNMFPPHERTHICMRLAGSLKGVVSQKLVPKADGKGRVAAVEIMVVTPTVAKLIEEGHFGQLPAAIAEGGFWGMQTMNQSLVKFVKEGAVTEQEACFNAGNLTEMKQMLRR